MNLVNLAKKMEELDVIKSKKEKLRDDWKKGVSCVLNIFEGRAPTASRHYVR